MTLQQTIAFSIIAVMMGLFIWGRLRYDLVAVLALLAPAAQASRLRALANQYLEPRPEEARRLP